MIDFVHPIIFLTPTLCVSFFGARLLGYHASLVFIALLCGSALLSGILSIVIPLSLAVLFTYVVLYIISILVLLKHRQDLYNIIKANWIWGVGLAVIFGLWLTMDRIVTRWDNFSHWLLAPKSFNFTSEIFNSDLVDAFSYPPFNPLLLYFSKGFMDFREEHAVFLHLTLVVLLSIPIMEAIFRKVSKNSMKLLASILSILTVFSFITILFQLTAEIQSFYSDFIAAILIGSSSYLLFKLMLSKDYKALILVIPIVLSLTITRAAGLELALGVLGVFCLTAFLIGLFKIADRQHSFKSSAIIFMLMVCCFGLTNGWEASVKVRHGEEAFINNMHFSLDPYYRILFDSKDEKAQLVRKRVTSAFNQHTNMLHRGKQGSLLDRVTNRSSANTLGYWLGILITLGIIAGIQLFKHKQKRWTYIIAFILTLGVLAVYMLSILMTGYLQNNLLGGFPRYSFIYIAGIILFLYLVIFLEDKLEHKWLIGLFSLTILTTTPFVLGSIFENPVGLVRDVTFEARANLTRNDARLHVRHISQNSFATDAEPGMVVGDKAYIIWQGNNSYLYWLSRGELGGIGANDNKCPHVIVAKRNAVNDRRCPYKAQELLNILKEQNYDWLFVGHAGEGFRTYVSRISTNLPEDFLASGKEGFLLKVTDDKLEFTKYISEE